MRGSVYYQTAQLAKVIFCKGLKKKDKINPNHPDFNKVSSYSTMESYRNIWNNFFHYLREHWRLKDPIMIEDFHISSYMLYKVEYYPSKQYLEKISAAFAKLEYALYLYTKENFERAKVYDFSIRQKILDTSRDLKKVADNYHNRAYDNPKQIIRQLSNLKHKIAALIQYEGGARIEGIGLIKKEQLKGARFDDITNSSKFVIVTKEKGGKVGDVLINPKTYYFLSKFISANGRFYINKQKYTEDIRNSCKLLGIYPDGSHGFRWNFAQRRMREYAKAGYTYEQSLLKVSSEMKHNRAIITEHYLAK